MYAWLNVGGFDVRLAVFQKKFSKVIAFDVNQKKTFFVKIFDAF